MKVQSAKKSNTNAAVKFMKTAHKKAAHLSNKAIYLMVLASQLKKLLGPASLQYFIETGETVVLNKQAS
jgi:hypothetical protein